MTKFESSESRPEKEQPRQPMVELDQQDLQGIQGGFNPQPEPPASSFGGLSSMQKNRFRGTSFGR